MSSAPTEQQQKSVTVKEHFDHCMREYDASILDNTTLDSTSTEFQSKLVKLLADLASMWHRLEAAGALSINDELEDLTTNTIEMLMTPFVVADLHQRRLDAVEDEDEGAANGSTMAPSSSSSSTSPAVPESLNRKRAKALTVSLFYFESFLKLMIQVGITTDKDCEINCRFSPADRMRRVENHRTMTELRQQLKEAEDRVRYAAAKSKRMRLLCEADGDEYEERGGEEEEMLRDRAVKRLRWAVLFTFQQVQMTSRELQMLETLTDEQRREAVHEYQRNVEEAKRSGGLGVGRDTYTILPGGVVMTGAPQIQRRAMSQLGGNNSNTAAAIAAATAGMTYREQVRGEVYMDRNRPTMTLEEFAAMEMQEIQRQMDAQADAAARQQEEDERLGPDGIEERQRQYDMYWSNWKDENPAIGISTKGNYT
ncbi:Hypothetical protein, putative [Bodo saltans]|uniref:TAP42-like protein n=1 Tax=Bodo saltans TaxID=75058 RepID=A0A0S4JC44_BODSA|nr:Hypothetical protein, putative [Bodo saltans]|eukprot:CUG87575.1 Hypothetical protein, putative [Bodo saltans]